MKILAKIKRFLRSNTHVTLRLSDDQSVYYVENLAGGWDFWMSSKKIDGPVPEKDKKNTSLFQPNPVEIRHNDGRVWHRYVYPFTFFKVNSGEKLREKVAWTDDRVQDWLCHQANSK